MLVVGLGGCGRGVRDPGVFVLASGADLESANPVVTVHTLSRQMQRHMLFMPLVRLSGALEPEPWLARRWQFSADSTVLTFVLRTDVPWHDGTPTTARDVAFTFNAAKDPATGSPRAADLATVDRVEVVDDSTVALHFQRPQRTIPLVFAELPPVPEHLLRDVPRERWRQHAFSTSPVGNGPFRFLSRRAGQLWRFGRNEAFPADLGGPPPAREVVIAVVDEPATKFAGLVSGELDVAGISPAMAELVVRDPQLVLENPPVLFTTVLAFNSTASPFSDGRVRRAVSVAINRQRIVDAAVAGFALPSRSVVPPGVLAVPSPPEAAPVDSAAASRLLDTAGWRRQGSDVRRRAGQALEITLLTVGTGDLAVEQLLQDDLRRVGIALTIRSVELASFLAELRAPEKQFDMAYTGLPGDLGLGHIVAMLHSEQAGGALDYTGFHTAALDALLDGARRTVAAHARAVAWRDVDRYLSDSVPVAVVYHAKGVQGRTRTLGNVTMDLRGELASIARWTRIP